MHIRHQLLTNGNVMAHRHTPAVQHPCRTVMVPAHHWHARLYAARIGISTVHHRRLHAARGGGRMPPVLRDMDAPPEADELERSAALTRRRRPDPSEGGRGRRAFAADPDDEDLGFLSNEEAKQARQQLRREEGHSGRAGFEGERVLVPGASERRGRDGSDRGRGGRGSRGGRGRVGMQGRGTAGIDAVTDVDGTSTSGRQAGGEHRTFRHQPLKQQVTRELEAAMPLVRPNDGDKGTFFSGKSWRQLGVEAQDIEVLSSLGLTRPSHIQAEAFDVLGGGAQHVALADQAGSGKTLAYLLPQLLALRQEERAAGRPCTVPGSPRLVVLAPTTELVQQVHRVSRALSRAGLRHRSLAMTGGEKDDDKRARSFRTQADCIKEGVDLLVATPGRLLEHLRRGSMKLEATNAVVMDEVDVLCGDVEAQREFVEPLQQAAHKGLRFLLVSATLPQHIFVQLQELFPGLQPAFGPGLHRTAAGLVEELIDCSGGDEVNLETGTARKLQALRSTLAAHGAQRVVVFCNKIETCRVVENGLKRAEKDERRYEVLAYHEAVRDDLRAAALRRFLTPTTQQEQQLPVVLVCTDRTSRGIDSMFCEHVVLFDFPRDPSEYVRRVGRTARGAGGHGVVSVLALGRQVALARDIIDKTQKGAPVHRIPEAAYY